MRRWLILIPTHLMMLAIGFAGGICALPILTAPQAPDTAALQMITDETLRERRLERSLKGSDLLHLGEGDVRVEVSDIGVNVRRFGQPWAI